MKTLKGMTFNTKVVRLIEKRVAQAEGPEVKELRGAMFELPAQQEGFLSIFKVAAPNPAQREALLRQWFEEGTEVELEVIAEGVRHGQLSYSLSQWPVYHRSRQEEQSERNALLAEIKDGDTFEGVIDHVDEKKGTFAIVDLGNGVSGLLHEDEVIGLTPEQRRKRLKEDLVPDTHVRVCVRNRRTDDGFTKLYLSERLVLIREEYARLGLDDPTAILAAADSNKS